MIFKVYNPETDNGFIIIESIKELAEVCNTTPNEAKKAYYNSVTVINGYDVIAYR